MCYTLYMDNLDKIFRAYDVRGAYPQELDETTAYKIGRATAKFLKTKEIIVGQDNRPSSAALFNSLVSGIVDRGVNVVDMGVVTTPMFYFSVVKLNLKGGIMITASHNPENYNGFKIIKEKAMPIGVDSGLEKIKKLIVKNKFKNKNKGTLANKDILNDYLDYLSASIDFQITRPLKIFVDYGKSESEKIISALFKGKPIEIVKSLSDNFDLGVVFDRDGDRINFLDEKKQELDSDVVSALLIGKFFRKTGKIPYPVMASMVLKEEILNNDNEILYSKIGHAHVKKIMEKKKAVFGAESSGHYYFKDGYVLESPITALIKVMQIILEENKPLSRIISPLQRYYLERINIQTRDFKRISKNLIQAYKKTGKISCLDGIKIEFADWWFNLRQSNTESVLRLTIEAKTRELLEVKKKELSKLVPF